MIEATKTLPHPAPEVITLARWLARKAIKTQLKAAGLRPEYIEVREIGAAANAYFIRHKEKLIAEARAHPALLRLR
jgi:hypothetical protein